MMTNKNWKEFIKNAREEYKKIGSVTCPAFGKEKIYFTSEGFKHLIFRDRKYRPKSDQVRRVKLIGHIIDVLKSSTKYTKYSSFEVNTNICLNTVNITHHLWSFIDQIDNKRITVVVRQIGTGSKHFLSIMSK